MAKVVFIEPEKPNVEHEIQKLYRARYSELADSTEDYEILEETSKRRSSANKEYSNRKVIKICRKSSKEDLWGMVQNLKEETTAE